MRLAPAWRAITRALGVSRNTIRKILREHAQGRDSGHSALPKRPERVPRAKKIDAYRAQVQVLLARYPDITLQSVEISGSLEQPSLLMRVTIRNVTRNVGTIATVRQAGDRLVAEGEFDVEQTDFGITPFSVGLGALQVQDRVRVRFSIVCVVEP